MPLTDALQNNFKTQFAKELKETFDPVSEDNYYLFFGNALPWADETTPPTVVDSVSEHFDALRNGLFAIRIDSRNTAIVVPRINWTSGVVYDQYDHTLDLHDVDNLKRYYVIADGDRVYKCLSNNGGSASTTKPSFTGTYIFTTADGYKWKFLYKLTEEQKDFLTDEYIPVFVSEKNSDEVGQLQYDVQTKAVDGEIYRVDITNTSSVGTYDVAFPSGVASIPKKVALAGASTIVVDDTDSNIELTANAYDGYMFYVSAGVGPEVGQLRRITDYSENATTGEWEITLDSPLEYDVFGKNTSDRSQFRILPEILIHGDGVNVNAYMTVDGNKKPDSVYILNGGKEYKYAYATFPTTITGTEPTAKIYISPKGGHGSNPIEELDASRIMIRLMNENIENQPEIINVNDFRQFGIVKNPILNDNSLRVAGDEYDRKTTIRIRKPYGLTAEYYDFASASPTFKVGNYVYGFESNAVAEVDSWELDSNRSSGTLILKNTSKNFNLPSTIQQLVRINMGSSGASGDFIVNENVTQYNDVVGATASGAVKYWDAANYELVLRLSATGSYTAIPFTTETSNPIIGQSSKAYHYDYLNLEDEGGELIGTFGTTSGLFNKLNNTTKIARIDEGVNTYIDVSETPVYRMTTIMEVAGAGLDESTFTLDDGITQTNSRLFTTANVASWTPDSGGGTGSLVLTNVVGSFVSGDTFDAPSGEYTINSITEPDLVIGSGEVLYIQNIRPIDRQSRQREEFRISIGF